MESSRFHGVLSLLKPVLHPSLSEFYSLNQKNDWLNREWFLNVWKLLDEQNNSLTAGF